MCGIVGMFTKKTNFVLTKPLVTTFKQMLYADALRGWDSTGVMAVSDTDTKVVKAATTAQTFLSQQPEHAWAFNRKILIGHNRSATRGAVNDDNAHPFQEGHITLVHNGSLVYHHHLKDVAVDSHAITHSIVEKGDIKTLEQLHGAYALVWYNEDTKVLHATRNNERPLWLLEGDDIYMLSSERGLGAWIAGRNGIDIKKETLLEVGIVYDFKPNKKNKIYIVKRSYKMYVPPKVEPQIKPVVDNVVRLPPPQQGGPIHYQPTSPIDLERDDIVEVLPYSKHYLGYASYGLGKYRWACSHLDLPDVIFELYDNDEDLDITKKPITATVHSRWWSPVSSKWVVILKNPTLIDDEEEDLKKRDDESGVIYTRNGVALTKAVVSLAKESCCEDCTAGFEYSTEITLTPVIRGKHVYKYKYRCPTCSDWHEFQNESRGAMH